MQGGTHVNGLRQGLLDAMREFCEYRNILPRGVKLSAEDMLDAMREFCEYRNILPRGVKLSAEDSWDRCAYVLSVKIQDPQFAGQTK